MKLTGRRSNTDAFDVLVSYIGPNPLVFCRLAMVSRDLNSFFTSDGVWTRFNPYGLGANIFRHFQEHMSDFDGQLLKIFWSLDRLNYDFTVLTEYLVQNRYTLVSSLRCSGTTQKIEINDATLTDSSDFMFCAARISSILGTVYSLASGKLQANPDFYILCGYPMPTGNTFLDATKEKVLKVLKSGPPFGVDEDFSAWVLQVPQHLVNDPEIIDVAGITNAYWILELDHQVASDLLLGSEKMIRLSLELHGHHFVEAFPSMVTKHLICTVEHDDWHNILRVVDQDWHRDIKFLEKALDENDDNVSRFIRQDLKEDITWLNQMCLIFTFSQYVLYMEDGYMQTDLPTSEYIEGMVETAAETGAIGFLTLEYFRALYRRGGSLHLFTDIMPDESYFDCAFEMGLDFPPWLIPESVMANKSKALALLKTNPAFFYELPAGFRSESEFFQALCNYFEVDGRAWCFHLTALPRKWLKPHHMRRLLSNETITVLYSPSTLRYFIYNAELLELVMRKRAHPTELIEAMAPRLRQDTTFVIIGNFCYETAIVFKLLKPALVQYVGDYYFLTTLAKKHGIYLKELFFDKYILALSIDNHPDSILFAPETFTSDIEFMCQLVAINAAILASLSLEIAKKVVCSEFFGKLSKIGAMVTIHGNIFDQRDETA